jgi:TRAP transporter TAXI family solute receptor
MFDVVRRSFAAGAVAIGIGLPATPVQAQEFINVLTGGTSGVYYPLGVALADIYGKGIEGARTQVQATKASVENLNLLQQGKGEIAFSLGDSVQLAAEGNTEVGFPGKLDKLRGVAAIYPNYIQIVASAESGIKSLDDLRGKSLSVGAPASGTELNARTIFEAAGMSYEDLGKVEYLPFAESVELIKNRQLDATLQSAGLGVASIRDLSTSLAINVVAVPADTVAKIGSPYVQAVIPAGTYEGQTEDVETAAVGNFLITHDGVSEETVYQMTKLLFDNLDQLTAAHAAAKAIDATKALEGMPIPLHPGAERYYREAGILK